MKFRKQWEIVLSVCLDLGVDVWGFEGVDVWGCEKKVWRTYEESDVVWIGVC